MTTERMELRRAIAVDPTTTFDAVRSPERHVAIDASGMLMPATRELATKAGDSFVVHMESEVLNNWDSRFPSPKRHG